MTVTIERVLAATDFSKAGQRAVEVAAEWARDTGASLRIVHVTPPKRWLGDAWRLKASVVDSIEHHAANALKQAAERADPQRRLELSTAVLSGQAARSIVHAARDYGAELLVVGARGERDAQGERVLGGTSAKLLATAESPLLLVRRPHKDPVAGVVAAVDLSPHSSAVLAWADFAAAARHLFAYHVYDVPFAARLEAYGLAPTAIDVYSEQARSECESELAARVASIARTGVTTRAVERGEPAALLRRYIESIGPSLVVLGKHGRRTGASTAHPAGDVCRLIASNAAADVLVV
jgi:nucleotide-binding universal stress UspA family protein